MRYWALSILAGVLVALGPQIAAAPDGGAGTDGSTPGDPGSVVGAWNCVRVNYDQSTLAATDNTAAAVSTGITLPPYTVVIASYIKHNTQFTSSNAGMKSLTVSLGNPGSPTAFS